MASTIIDFQGGKGQSGESIDGRPVPHVSGHLATATKTWLTDTLADTSHRVKQDWEALGNFNAITGWAVTTTDATTLAVANNHILGTKSLSFAKVNGAANGTIAAIEATIAAVDISRFTGSAAIEIGSFLSDLTDVASIEVRLGTDSSNYQTFTVADTALNAGVWDISRAAISTGVTTGTGWDMSAITYILCGVNFDLETDALAGMLFDYVVIMGAQYTTT
jgi:hypothetical protein